VAFGIAFRFAALARNMLSSSDMSLATAHTAQLPLQITFRGIDHSQAVEAAIRQRAARLARFSGLIQRFHVTVDMPHQHRHRGNHYAIRIELTTPSGEVVVSRDPSLDDSHKDFQSVLRDAFDAAARHLESNAQRTQTGAKDRDQPPPGRVTRLFPEQGYGFLTTAEGEDVYFNENSVRGASFAQLSIGSEVSFTIAPEDADQGARAASVQLLPA
jgi:cold shock CspA family protein/ribosome-associated translation inhibitor RaiA